MWKKKKATKRKEIRIELKLNRITTKENQQKLFNALSLILDVNDLYQDITHKEPH